MILGLKVITPVNDLIPKWLQNIEATITYLDENGTRVMLDCGYFWEIKDLTFVDQSIDDPLLFAKCIEKHGSLIKALKYSIRKAPIKGPLLQLN